MLSLQRSFFAMSLEESLFSNIKYTASRSFPQVVFLLNTGSVRKASISSFEREVYGTEDLMIESFERENKGSFA